MSVSIKVPNFNCLTVIMTHDYNVRRWELVNIDHYMKDQHILIVKHYYQNALTLNGKRYRAMITQFFVPHLEYIALDNTWFQQDMPYMSYCSSRFIVLHKYAPGRAIFQFSNQNWPPRSCDLTLLDFWL